jgi:poly-beta-1,6-N-acetyl-D-glucosamine N-deacetylase
MKKLLREVVAFLLIQYYYIFKPKSDGILSIYFHNPSKQLFEKILKWLVKKKYKFISIQKLDYFIQNKLKAKKLVFISLDDGWKGNLDLLKSIEKFKVPIIIFVPIGAVIEGNYWWEYAMQKDQHGYSGVEKLEDFKCLPEDLFKEKIKILKSKFNLKRSCITLDDLKKIKEHELITIGSHTVTHPILTKCSIETKTHELMESKLVLSKWLEREIDFLSYPNGNYDDDTIEIAQRCAYKLAFTTNPGKIDVEKVNAYLIPRNAMYDKGGYFENISKILGIWQTVFNRNLNLNLHNPIPGILLL